MGMVWVATPTRGYAVPRRPTTRPEIATMRNQMGSLGTCNRTKRSAPGLSPPAHLPPQKKRTQEEAIQKKRSANCITEQKQFAALKDRLECWQFSVLSATTLHTLSTDKCQHSANSTPNLTRCKASKSDWYVGTGDAVLLRLDTKMDMAALHHGPRRTRVRHGAAD
jgi:hypothetical protein